MEPMEATEEFTGNINQKVVHHIHYSYAKIMEYEAKIVEYEKRIQALEDLFQKRTRFLRGCIDDLETKIAELQGRHCEWKKSPM